jgi:hypothetical protein
MVQYGLIRELSRAERRELAAWLTATWGESMGGVNGENGDTLPEASMRGENGEIVPGAIPGPQAASVSPDKAGLGEMRLTGGTTAVSPTVDRRCAWP